MEIKIFAIDDDSVTGIVATLQGKIGNQTLV
jgi:hypothetical protein